MFWEAICTTYIIGQTASLSVRGCEPHAWNRLSYVAWSGSGACDKKERRRVEASEALQRRTHGMHRSVLVAMQPEGIISFSDSPPPSEVG